MTGLRKLWYDEPAVIIGLLETVIDLAVVFGLSLTPEQIGAVLVFMRTLATFFTRLNVSPTRRSQDQAEWLIGEATHRVATAE